MRTSVDDVAAPALRAQARERAAHAPTDHSDLGASERAEMQRRTANVVHGALPVEARHEVACGLVVDRHLAAVPGAVQTR